MDMLIQSPTPQQDYINIIEPRNNISKNNINYYTSDSSLITKGENKVLYEFIM